jgi:plasmid stabilization system protein ParE
MNLQKFKSHKVVEAMKIARIVPPSPGKNTILVGADGGEIMVVPYYVDKHQPQAGGYYVRYEDGYESWSPAEAFESGYAPVREAESTTRYPLTDEARRRFDNTFTYHAPKGDQAQRYTELRELAKNLALVAAQLTPPGREQALALTKLEEFAFWANAAIARGEK